MTPIDKAEELLPCPFCGDMPTFWNAREDVLLCPCLAGPEVHGTSRENAIAAWNRRAIPATNARADALREAVAAICAEDDDFIGIGKSSYDKADRILALIGEPRT